MKNFLILVSYLLNTAVFGMILTPIVMPFFLTGYWGGENGELIFNVFVLTTSWILGVWFLFGWVWLLRLKRLVENIATARIKTSAAGAFVELHGKLVLDFRVRGRFVPPQYFCEVASAKFLLIKDKSGRGALVFLEGALLDTGSYWWYPSYMRLSNAKISSDSAFGGQWSPSKNGKVYVMGYSYPSSAPPTSFFSRENQPDIKNFVEATVSKMALKTKARAPSTKPFVNPLDVPEYQWLNTFIDQTTDSPEIKRRIIKLISRIALVMRAEPGQPLLIAGKDEKGITRAFKLRAIMFSVAFLFMMLWGPFWIHGLDYVPLPGPWIEVFAIAAGLFLYFGMPLIFILLSNLFEGKGKHR